MKRLKLFSALLAFFTAAFPLSACNSGAEESAAADFRIMTWNIYLGKGEGEDAVDVICDVRPDVLHLQEAKGAYESVIQPLISQVGEYVLLNDEVGGFQCSTPVIYNSDKINIIANGTEYLKDVFDNTPKLSNTKSIGWAVFELKDSGKTWIDINFHGAVCAQKYYEEEKTDGWLEWQGDEWRKGNVRQILDKIAEIKDAYGASSTIVTGDCNFNSESGAYKLFTEAGFHEAEKTAASRTNDGLRTTHGLGEASAKGLTIDHIFGNGSVEFLVHSIIRTETALTASDHNPVWADLKLK